MTNPTLPEGPLVTVQWLHLFMNHPLIKIVEAKMKPIGAPENWESGHKIPGAVQMDINADFSILDTELPHMMPSEEHFAQSAKKLGINHDSIVIVYDQVGTYGSPRGWWMFRAMGHRKVFVLDGGLPAWQNAEYETEEAQWPEVPSGNFEAMVDKSLFYKSDDILSIIGKATHQIMDARSKGRFDATAPEPRPGLRGGHIPGSVCLPFQEVQDGIYMKSVEELKAIFEPFSIGDKQLVMSCGSGVTASIIALAAELAEYSNPAVYDGSWAEWGMQNEEWPVAK